MENSKITGTQQAKIFCLVSSLADVKKYPAGFLDNYIPVLTIIESSCNAVVLNYILGQISLFHGAAFRMGLYSQDPDRYKRLEF